MRFRLLHPEIPFALASYGYTCTRGFYVRALLSSGLWIYDTRQQNYDHRRPLEGALRYLVGRGFIEQNDLDEGLDGIRHQCLEDLPRDARRAAKIYLNLKRAAD